MRCGTLPLADRCKDEFIIMLGLVAGKKQPVKPHAMHALLVPELPKLRDQGIEVDNWVLGCNGIARKCDDYKRIQGYLAPVLQPDMQQPGGPPVFMLCTNPRLRYTDAVLRCQAKAVERACTEALRARAQTLLGCNGRSPLIYALAHADASLIFMLPLGHLLLLGLVKGFWEKFGRSYRCVTKSAGTWTMEDRMMFCTCHERFLLRDNLMGDQFTEAWRSLCDASCFALRAVHPDDFAPAIHAGRHPDLCGAPAAVFPAGGAALAPLAHAQPASGNCASGAAAAAFHGLTNGARVLIDWLPRLARELHR
ncbi:hypothetical protein WJX81_000174 [Elliptochloris bilobata]|uniref:Uncharacterized protein n=1 Tax=Elliptochloris bilobata TaxID=381761 RepID=A0AAW1RKC5_9CHLO